jgi:hypothetical protein
MANTPSITSKEFKQFNKWMTETKMSPLQRCQWNTMKKQYIQMMEMDFKTQDRYEQELCQLRRQINTQAETIRLKDKTIHEGADDETPLPVLDMMNRLDAMETKYERLRHRTFEAVAEQNDLEEIAKLGNELWAELNPEKDEYGYSKDAIYQDLIQDAMDKELLVGNECHEELEQERDDLQEELDNEKEERALAWKEVETLRAEQMKTSEQIQEWHKKYTEAKWEVVKVEERLESACLERDGAKDDADNWKKAMTDAQWEAVSLGETLAEIPNWAKKTPRTLAILNDFMERSESWSEYHDFVKEYYPEEPHTDSEDEEEPEPAQEDPELSSEDAKHADGMAKFLMETFPGQLKEVPKMEKFLSQRGHIKMEQADTTNNTKWFAEMVKRGYFPAMKKHRQMTNCFDWNNWDAWVKTRQ